MRTPTRRARILIQLPIGSSGSLFMVHTGFTAAAPRLKLCKHPIAGPRLVSSMADRVIRGIATSRLTAIFLP
jgi:hypothetical protein